MIKSKKYVVLCSDKQYELYSYCVNHPNIMSDKQLKIAAQGIKSLLFKGVPLVTTVPRGFSVVDVRRLKADGGDEVVYFNTMIRKWIRKFHLFVK